MVRLSDIVENSESEQISTTESLASEQDLLEIESSNLDDLFKQLSSEINNGEKIVDDKRAVDKISSSLKKLPKIHSNFDNLTATKHSIKIDDAVIIKPVKPINTDSGSKWFNMPKGELTTSVKRDLSIIQQRNALDPKRHYKKEKWAIPEYFQMGTIIEGNTEFYSARINRKQRGTSLVNEILNDDTTKKYFKRKYSEIQEKKTSGRKAHYKKVKEMRKKF